MLHPLPKVIIHLTWLQYITTPLGQEQEYQKSSQILNSQDCNIIVMTMGAGALQYSAHLKEFPLLE